MPKAYLKELMRKAKGGPVSCECTCTCGFYPRGTKLVPPVNQLLRPTVTTQLPLLGLATVSSSLSMNHSVQGPLSADASALFSVAPVPFSVASAPLGSSGASAFSPLPQSVLFHTQTIPSQRPPLLRSPLLHPRRVCPVHPNIQEFPYAHVGRGRDPQGQSALQLKCPPRN